MFCDCSRYSYDLFHLLAYMLNVAGRVNIYFLN